MKILSIIPVKDLNCTKTRLGSILSLGQRQILTLQILYRTLKILKSSAEIEKILVLTPDSRVLSFAKERGVLGLKEEGKGLNEVLEQATYWSIHNDFGAIFILPSDLPFLQQEDIQAIIDMGVEEERSVVIAPDWEMEGTNALFVKPPGIIQYEFGFDSFEHHQKQALKRGLKFNVYSSTTIGFDLDYPDQYRFLMKKSVALEEISHYEGKTCNFNSNHWNSPHPTRR